MRVYRENDGENEKKRNWNQTIRIELDQSWVWKKEKEWVKCTFITDSQIQIKIGVRKSS